MAKKWTEDERRAGERISDFSGMRIVKPKEKAKKRYEYLEKPAKCPDAVMPALPISCMGSQFFPKSSMLR